MPFAPGFVAKEARIAAVIAAVVAAALPLVLLSGFTVDDALVPARYAMSLARGEGYRPSAGAPVSDGVTPLGFAHLLVPFAGDGVQGAHRAARALGVTAWLVAAGGLGDAIARLGGSRRRHAALLLLATSAPLAGWAVAGLETGLVTALVAAGLALRERGHGRIGSTALGLAAGWRPELAPFSVIVAFAAGPRERARCDDAPQGAADAAPGARVARTALAIAPLLLIAAIRAATFGRAAPLSVLAKTPVWSLGVAYAGAAALLAGLVAVAAPLALRRAEGWTRALALGVLAHVGAMAFAGGDWMPLARLAVPVAPAAVLVSARLLGADEGARRFPGGSVALLAAIALQIFGFSRSLDAAAEVAPARAALIEEMRPVLADVRVIAAVDVGWVGAAAEHARIVDLAGITDPSIAALGGGHTTRRVPRTLFDDRRVDAIVLLLARREEATGSTQWPSLAFARGTEAWIATMPGIGEEFELLHVGRARPRYVVLRRIHAAAE